MNILYTYLDAPLLCPLSKQSHDTRTKQERNNHEGKTFVVFCSVRVKDEVSGQQLNKTSVDQDTRTDRVEYTADDIGSERVGVVSRAQTEPNSDTDGGRETVGDAQ